MSIRIHNGYLLKMDLHEAHKLCQRMAVLAKAQAELHVAQMMALIVVGAQDLKDVGLEDKKEDYGSAWIHLRNRFKECQQKRERDPMADVETEVFMRPFPARHYPKGHYPHGGPWVLARLQTELEAVKGWWASQKGVYPYFFDNGGGPEDHESKGAAYQAWKKRGRVWEAVDGVHDFTFTTIGIHHYPLPMTERVRELIPPYENRVHATGQSMADHEWTKAHPGADHMDYIRWIQTGERAEVLERHKATAREKISKDPQVI